MAASYASTSVVGEPIVYENFKLSNVLSQLYFTWDSVPDLRPQEPEGFNSISSTVELRS